MSGTDLHFVNRAAELRAEFDLSFAAAHQEDRARGDSFLEIKVGDGVFTLRLGEIAGLFSDYRITPIPSTAPSLLGVASFRGVITPVYSLEAFFEKQVNGAARWLVVAATAQVAFAFTGLIGHTQRSSSDALPTASLTKAPGQRAQKFTRHFLPIGDHLRPIIDLPAIVAEIRAISSKSTPPVSSGSGNGK